MEARGGAGVLNFFNYFQNLLFQLMPKKNFRIFWFFHKLLFALLK